MTLFTVHNPKTAPEQSVGPLQRAEAAYGFVPNLIGVLAESPAAVEAYLDLSQIFDKSAFSRTERQVVLLAISRYHECHYCVAAHSTIAQMQKVPAEVVSAIRTDQPIPDRKLEALRAFTTVVVGQRGWVSGKDLNAFLTAGYEKRHVLEVIVGAAFKTISNYTNHVTETPVDSAFANNRWEAPAALESVKAIRN